MRGKTADILSICIEHFKMHLFTALSRESYPSINGEVRMHVEADGVAGIQQALLSQRTHAGLPQHQTQSDGSHFHPLDVQEVHHICKRESRNQSCDRHYLYVDIMQQLPVG